MTECFGIIDFIDIALVAALLLYIYLAMKKSGAINIFLGIVFLLVLFAVLRISRMTLMKGIFNTIISQGAIILIILFQNEIRHFLSDVGSNSNLRFIKRFMHRPDAADKRKWIMPIVYACMTMAKSKTGALIVVQKSMSLSDYVHTGDVLDAKVNNRLLENIFFKNSPLHDGAVIISEGRILAAGCILPVSHDRNLPRYLGLRHRSALGISQETDAISVVVSEETGNISCAYKGEIFLKLSSTELDHKLTELLNE
ncbi:MAG: diadenylate cyclase CdaA [bacterium]|nr:diadenylate cyclase CdaA [bacterium]MDD6901379.1 diadenylate cyclase CdaA [bacterium]